MKTAIFTFCLLPRNHTTPPHCHLIQFCYLYHDYFSFGNYSKVAKANFQQIDVHLDFLVQNITVKVIFVTLLPLYRTSSHKNSFQILIITDSIHSL